MRLLTMPCLLAGAVATVSLLGFGSDQGTQDPKGKPNAEQMAEMMLKAKKFTEPSEHHKLLERFLGEWKVESRMFMAGESTPPEKGTATYTWLMKDRFIKGDISASMMGRAWTGISIMGYDNFKKSYLMTNLNSLETAIRHSEGDLDPGGKALIMYGTLDEYLTGEHDKMVKYLWRFVSENEIIHEVHDLPIGEKNTKVIEFRFYR